VIPLSVEPAQDPPKGFSDRSGAVFIGRLQEEKGVLDVLRLGQLLPSVDVRVVGYGPLENAVAEAARRHANISFLGRLGRGGVMRELGRARICVMPSRWQEPAGIAALEAMSVGTPVVAYRSGGLAEYVRDAGGGEVITASAIALARACETLHHDGRRWQVLRCRHWVCSTRTLAGAVRFTRRGTLSSSAEYQPGLAGGAWRARLTAPVETSGACLEPDRSVIGATRA
jgi:glycosyltransferase involved in cell wall biosynthesis